MLLITEKIIGAEFESTDIKNPATLNNTYTCIGYGQNPDAGANYIVGSLYDSVNNRTLISTHLIATVRFKGKIP